MPSELDFCGPSSIGRKSTGFQVAKDSEVNDAFAQENHPISMLTYHGFPFCF